PLPTTPNLQVCDIFSARGSAKQPVFSSLEPSSTKMPQSGAFFWLRRRLGKWICPVNWLNELRPCESKDMHLFTAAGGILRRCSLRCQVGVALAQPNRARPNGVAFIDECLSRSLPRPGEPNRQASQGMPAPVVITQPNERCHPGRGLPGGQVW